MLQKKLQDFLYKQQEELFYNPQKGIESDLKKIYDNNEISLGWPKNSIKIFEHLSRKNSVIIVGTALGDEGKGRLVDNKIKEILKKKGVNKVFAIRFQGGNNAGHTLETKNIKLALHLIPAGVLNQKTTGLMDRGMVIHPEDLQTEIEYVEGAVGNLKGKLFLSEDAILCTDLERAEEKLNGIKKGHAKGGTGRGIAPSYAHFYDRLGLKVYDLLTSDWKSILENHYERYEKEFLCFGLKVSQIEVPDYKETVKEGKAIQRLIGSKKEFLKRLEIARNFLLQRSMVVNTFPIHQKIFNDKTVGVIFEGSQAAGLDAWLGTRPDVTSSNTSVYGIREGTAFWTIQSIEEKIGVFKIPYTSSVGRRQMPTHIDLPKDLSQLSKNSTLDQKWAAYIRETAHEYGTTTGRPRDINFLDLSFIRYNCRMSGIEMLAGTHLDIAKEDQLIKVCTHYVDNKGTSIQYQPGLRYLKDVIPCYVELPGWNGEACKKAKKAKDLPINALKFLSFIQSRTGFPIITVTTGAKRENIINF